MDKLEDPSSGLPAAWPATSASAPSTEPVPVVPGRPSAVGPIVMAVLGYPLSNVLALLPWLAFMGLARLVVPSVGLHGGLWASMASPLGLLAMLAATALGIIVVVLPAAGSGWARQREALGLVRPGLGGAQLGLALLGTVAAACISGGAVGLALRAHWLPPIPRSSIVVQLTNMLTHASFPLALATALSVGLFPGVGEELMFRGYVQRRLLRCWPAWLAIATSGMLFSMWHLHPARILGSLPIALWLGYVAWRGRSILPTIACHAFNNSAAALLAMAGARAGYAQGRQVPLSGLWAAFALGTLLLTIAGGEFERRWRAAEAGRMGSAPADAAPAAQTIG